MRMAVKKDQIYKAKGKRGYRFVRIHRVRLAGSNEPYVELYEVDEQGNKKSGRSWSQIPRSLKFETRLTCDDGKWVMPLFYSFVTEVTK